MSRKVLNDVRSLLSKKGYINTHRIMNEDLAKPNNINLPRTSSRFQKHLSRNEIKRSLSNIHNKYKK